ncbi:AAA family ATPase [Streptomyces angustmyceticus]|uniref:Transcriptional regulator n=1 Tax=Streptomyces angustmyceticus TaxID=285578 RepID=A0A5J4L6B1_9ACTN|nr:LuxR family transcriptional regulator [Streptomyces angustmyceticus]UAL70768.1 AAA family ATPase [Streptomyces angustmyceticus]GES29917.1 transcriptional regulator [Streptomyces angustmyceticus]
MKPRRRGPGPQGRSAPSLLPGRTTGRWRQARDRPHPPAAAPGTEARIIDRDTELFGRDDELAEIDRVLGGVTASRGGLLLLHGEPGCGRSALLEQAGRRARALGATVVTAHGAEAEFPLAYAGLHQVLRPLLPGVAGLPPAQAEALSGALRLTAAPHADRLDRFLVSAAALSLLTGAATAGRGLVCLIDDAQWLDRPSVDALLFVARRLGPHGVGLLLARRDPGPPRLADPVLPRLALPGLDAEAAGALLSRRSGVRADAAVVREVTAATGGSPLLLSELGTNLTSRHLTGREALPRPLPLESGVLRAFLGPVRALPAAVRLALLVTAAEESGDLPAVAAALGRLGAEPSSVDAAEASGLVSVTGGRIAFRSPALRTAVYGATHPARRRLVHRALAEVLRPRAGDGRRARQLAAAALGPDEAVAAELQEAGELAHRRGEYAGCAALLDRAAQLTADADRRAERLHDAARAAWQAGQAARTEELVREALPLTDRPGTTGRLLRLRGAVELRGGVLTDACPTLVRAAGLLAADAPDDAARTLIQAAEAASHIGDLARYGELGRAAGRLPGRSPVVECTRLLLTGIGHVVAADTDRGTRLITAGVAAAHTAGDPLLVAWAGVGTFYLGEAAAALELLARVADEARASGHAGVLSSNLEFTAQLEMFSGRMTGAEALNDEGLRLARESGQENLAAIHLARRAFMCALRGDERRCREAAEAALATALARRIGIAAATARHALACVALMHGSYGEALRLLDLVAVPEPGSGHPLVAFFSLPDRIEAAVRAGERQAAEEALESFERWQGRATHGEARALLARSRALLASDDATAAGLFAEALELHSGSVPVEKARTELYFGESLRRARRRREARGHLRSAAATFARVGAGPWAERARQELRAAGESPQADGAGARSGEGRFTPQEVRIARLAAEGSTNKEIAARLFLSSRTVEYHLYKIFPRLGITSRRELVRLFHEDPDLFG